MVPDSNTEQGVVLEQGHALEAVLKYVLVMTPLVLECGQVGRTGAAAQRSVELGHRQERGTVLEECAVEKIHKKETVSKHLYVSQALGNGELGVAGPNAQEVVGSEALNLEQGPALLDPVLVPTRKYKIVISDLALIN